MGNFYCIPESCAKVVYQEYLPPSIRYRYPGENWQVIEGDDYAIEEKQQELPNDTYIFWRCRAYLVSKYGGYEHWREFSVKNRGLRNSGTTIPTGRPIFSEAAPSTASGGRDRLYVPYDPPHSITWYHDFDDYYPLEWEFFDICIVSSPSANNCDNGVKPSNNCTFTVYKNDQIVHQETRNVCPEVEKIDSRLSDVYKEVKVDKLSYLEGIEVTNYAKDILAVTNNFKADIPPNCLNIYATYLQPSIIPLESIKYLDAKFINQICSLPTLPPPSYQVICDCNKDCEFCPGDTCPIQCGDKICCYNDRGIAIKEIPISNYCGEL